MKGFRERVMKCAKLFTAAIAMVLAVGFASAQAEAAGTPQLYVSNSNAYQNKSTFTTADKIYLNTRYMTNVRAYEVKITGPGWNFSTRISNTTNAARFRLYDSFYGSYKGAGSYRWQVRAIDRQGRYGKWATRTFTVVPQKVNVKLSNGWQSGNYAYIPFSTQSKISGYQILYWNGQNWRHYSMIKPSNTYLKMHYPKWKAYHWKIRAYRDVAGKRYFGIASDKF